MLLSPADTSRAGWLYMVQVPLETKYTYISYIVVFYASGASY